MFDAGLRKSEAPAPGTRVARTAEAAAAAARGPDGGVAGGAWPACPCSPRAIRPDYAFSHRLRTRFAETDAMGVVHHAAYLPYLEEARVEYLRSIGHPYDAVRAGGRRRP